MATEYKKIRIQKTITNIGFKLDSDNSFNSQKSSIVKKYNYKLKQIKQMQKLLDRQFLKILIISTFIPNLD